MRPTCGPGPICAWFGGLRGGLRASEAHSYGVASPAASSIKIMRGDAHSVDNLTHQITLKLHLRCLRVRAPGELPEGSGRALGRSLGGAQRAPGGLPEGSRKNNGDNPEGYWKGYRRDSGGMPHRLADGLPEGLPEECPEVLPKGCLEGLPEGLPEGYRRPSGGLSEDFRRDRGRMSRRARKGLAENYRGISCNDHEGLPEGCRRAPGGHLQVSTRT